MRPLPHNTSPSRSHLAALVLVILIAAWIGIHGLNVDSFWLDEYWSLHHAGGAFLGPRTLIDVWNGIAATDPWQAPLYYLLLNQWGAVAGWTEFAARALSLFIGLLTIAGTYRLGKALRSPVTGVTAAALLAVSAYFLYFFHEMRAYTLYAFFVPFMVWAYWRLVNGKTQALWYIVLLVTIVGALYTHYFAALTAVALGLFHVCFPRFGRGRAPAQTWWLITGVFVLALIAFLPWLHVLYQGLQQASSETGVRGANALTAAEAVRGLLHLFTNGSTLMFALLLALTLRRTREEGFVWFWALAVLGLLLLINALLGVLLEVRYMLALWPALAVLAGLGIDRLYRYRSSWAAAVVGLWIIGGVWVSVDADASRALSNPHWHLPWRELRAQLLPRVASGDEVVMLLPDWTWAVYHGDTQKYYLRDLPAGSVLMEQPEHIGAAQYAVQAQQAVASANRVWLASDPTQPLTHRDDFVQVLEQAQYQFCAAVEHDDRLNLDLFARPPAAEQFVQFGTEPYVRAAALTPLPPSVSHSLNLSHFFTTTDPAWAARHSIAFHLDSADQELVAQADYGIPSEMIACRDIDLLLDDVPAGRYSLLMTIYNWETGERLVPVDLASVQVMTDKRIVLGVIDVEP